MKQIDQFDSLQHLDFSNSDNKKGEKLGSFLLALVAVIGLFTINSSLFHYSNSGTIEGEKVNKFWLTPSSLNAEKAAFKDTFQAAKSDITTTVSTTSL